MNWFVIPGFSRYEINKDGQVRHRRHKRILKRGIPGNGYAQVRVWDDIKNKEISKCVHQLMAITFMGNKSIGYEISFLIKDRNNINLTNLEYKLIKDNKIAKTRIITYCLFCGKENPKGNKKYCSKLHRFLDTRTLVQCKYCRKLFYRKNSAIKARNANPNYVTANIYCTRRCFHLNKKEKNK